MAKRSSYERNARDQYWTTDERAFRALAPFLRPRTTFAEPCVGRGDLVQGLRSLGHICLWQSDIEPHPAMLAHRMEGLAVTEQHLRGVQQIITNPPWTRSALHPLIVHFAALRPTWLLFDADWMHTQVSMPFLPLLRKVVSVGRLRWIEGTEDDGYDNAAWYLFDAKDGPYRRQRGVGVEVAPIEFHGRTEATRRERVRKRTTESAAG